MHVLAFSSLILFKNKVQSTKSWFDNSTGSFFYNKLADSSILVIANAQELRHKPVYLTGLTFFSATQSTDYFIIPYSTACVSVWGFFFVYSYWLTYPNL